MSPLSEEVIVPAASDVTRQRFEALYVQTRVPLLGYLLRRTDSPTDAADLLAETFLTAWRRIDDVPEDGGGRLWLYGVARRVLANHRRHLKVERTLAVTLEDSLRRELWALGGLGIEPLAGVIAGCLARLSEDDREIMRLSAWEQLAPAEIAEVMAVTPNAARVRLHRIRAGLREELLAAGYPQPGRVDCA